MGGSALTDPVIDVPHDDGGGVQGTPVDVEAPLVDLGKADIVPDPALDHG